MEKGMGKESAYGEMAQHMRVNGSMVKNMDMENLERKMDFFLKANLKMISNKGKEKCIIQMERLFIALGIMTELTEQVFIPMLKVNELKLLGIKICSYLLESKILIALIRCLSICFLS